MEVANAQAVVADLETSKGNALRAIERHRVRLFQLGAGVAVLAGAAFFGSNAIRGYWEPNPALAVIAGSGLLALALHRIWGNLRAAQAMLIGAMALGCAFIAFATGDFVRILPWWAFLSVYTVVAYDTPLGVVTTGAGYAVAGGAVAALSPTDKIPHPVLLATLIPAATAAVAGFKAVARRHLVEQWLAALHEVRIIRGVLPICMYCRRLRDDAGAWQQAEDYVVARADVVFAPGRCESCRAEEPGELAPTPAPHPPRTLDGRALIQAQRRGLFRVTVGLSVGVAGALIAVNLAKGYWTPTAPLAALMVAAVGLSFAARRKLSVDWALRLVLAMSISGVTIVGILSQDFLRIFGFWPYFVFLAAATLDRPREIGWTFFALTVLAGALALAIPGKGIPNLLLSAVLVSLATAAVSAFHILSRRRLLEELMGAIAEVRTLRGVLPFCSRCKKLRDDAGAWHELEAYIASRADVSFSHGVCQECLPRFRADMGLPSRAS